MPSSQYPTQSKVPAYCNSEWNTGNSIVLICLVGLLEKATVAGSPDFNNQGLMDFQNDNVVIPVALPYKTAQVFELTPEEIEEDTEQWLNRLDQFQNQTKESA